MAYNFQASHLLGSLFLLIENDSQIGRADFYKNMIESNVPILGLFNQERVLFSFI